MGYDLEPQNKELDGFHFGAFSFPVLQEACGYLWSCIHNSGQWYCVWGVDERMPEGDTYPRLISNDGFLVTEDEARIMARIARNYVAVQRSLQDDRVLPVNPFSLISPSSTWPQKIRDDFVDKFEAFADWADQSGGFEIW